ncbi:uncharacterized protein MAM_05336 [Metarhizium album ARSEF 1941]|uniref:DUF7624 domain-containing protein n=1 Tax=Metarhizium album (strain ARSEF 1941) TaxID=1081103 RepID=A0A0B2WV62_METAS|nr:uncharacterized protein MAM_05336 [Metarhizium album ARSEF 1941]KHN96780.1 hypothetical protein MAM_05336 [Metarhizium album ARSEF 1941]
MAIEAPLRSSAGNLRFPLNKEGDISASPETEGLPSPYRVVSSLPPVTDSVMLRSNSINRVSSNSMNVLSPSDIVGPSPVTSNGTETTEIEDDASEEVEQTSFEDESQRLELLVLSTNLSENFRQASGDEAVSVIHAPESFASWTSTESTAQQSQPSERSLPRGEEKNSSALQSSVQEPTSHPPRPPISTDVQPVRYSNDSATPRAQDLQDILADGGRLRSSSTSSLEKIDEQIEAEVDDDDAEDDYPANPFLRPVHDEITALRAALKECWTLCNTLASLSAIHRAQVFYSSGTPDAYEKAWKSCWKLCQCLYDNQDEDLASHNVRTNLELCRDFCQALFDVRQKKDETSDSVLRVSFELNNHLYSAQDSRKLPEPFRERTLDFYITLCHRLMRQRSELAEETDHLLSTCWALAEMLFSLRQTKRDGNPVDEELLGSAVQACWDLCDIFRDGWTQIRPDRNTPRPSQTSFFSQQPVEQSGRESRQSNRSSLHSKKASVKNSHQEERPRKPPPGPETPVTEFEDTPISPESESPQMPNIMVLGAPSDTDLGGRWSSNTSNMSSYSRGSNRTSSTATKTTATEDPNISRPKVLVLRAAMNMGFNREAAQEAESESIIFLKFVQGLPAGSFGSLSSHATLLQQYKSSVLSDNFIPRNQPLPVRGKRVVAQDMAKSVLAMSNVSPRYAYLRDLFKFVFQFSLDEAESRRNVSISV